MSYQSCPDWPELMEIAPDLQFKHLTVREAQLPAEALILVDDYDWDDVARATRDYVAAEPKAELLIEIAGEAGGQVWWWDGVAAVAWRV